MIEPDGLIEVFELSKDKHGLKIKPIRTLNCHYTLTNAFFSPWESNIVFGTSKSGDIFKWDLNKNEKFPIIKSVVAIKGHDHPVHGADIVGTGEKDATIISVSNLDLDSGSLCQWKSSDNFSKPHLNTNYKLKVEG